MFLTKECDYAIRVIRALADLDKKPVKTICDLEYIPRPFAYKILKKLEYAGIVLSSRGVTGGYRLMKTPGTLTIYDIVSAVADELLVNECLLDDYNCQRNSNGSLCGVHNEMSRIQEIIILALKEKNVAEVVEYFPE